MNVNEALSDIYFNPEKAGSFSSPLKLFEAVKESGVNNNISLANVRQFLKGIDVYTLHKNVKYKTRK